MLFEDQTIEVSITEFESLQKDARRIRALRNHMDERDMRRKLISQSRELLRLNRITLSHISMILSKDWNG